MTLDPHSSHHPRSPGRPVDPEARQARMTQILNAAKLCFAEKGFHGAGTAEISRSAGVSVANMYQYFASKEELIFALAEEALQEDLELILQLKDKPDLMAGLLQTFEAIVNGAHSDPAFWIRVEIFAEATRNERVRDRLVANELQAVQALTEILRQGQEAGQIRQDQSAEAMAEFLLRLVDGFYSGAGAGLVISSGAVSTALALIRAALSLNCNPLGI
ncbi:MAG: TetR/AcrR family transcriptional regulator [Verrucomicrobiales bacterium]